MALYHSAKLNAYNLQNPRFSLLRAGFFLNDKSKNSWITSLLKFDFCISISIVTRCKYLLTIKSDSVN